MQITDLTDEQLKQFESNYLRLGKVEGGIFSLAEIRVEQRRRIPAAIDVRDVVGAIVRLSNASADGLTTYGHLWAELYPNKPWLGPSTQSAIGNILAKVIGYCASKKLPIVTTLVVRKDSGDLSKEAIERIVNECRALGIEIGADASSFILSQRRSARALSSQGLSDW